MRSGCLTSRVVRHDALVAATDEIVQRLLERPAAFLGVPPLAVSAPAERVFAGSYASYPPQGLTMRLARWLLRRPLSDLRQRYGKVSINFGEPIELAALLRVGDRLGDRPPARPARTC